MDKLSSSPTPHHRCYTSDTIPNSSLALLQSCPSTQAVRHDVQPKGPDRTAPDATRLQRRPCSGSCLKKHIVCFPMASTARQCNMTFAHEVGDV